MNNRGHADHDDDWNDTTDPGQGHIPQVPYGQNPSEYGPYTERGADFGAPRQAGPPYGESGYGESGYGDSGYPDPPLRAGGDDIIYGGPAQRRPYGAGPAFGGPAGGPMPGRPGPGGPPPGPGGLPPGPGGFPPGPPGPGGFPPAGPGYGGRRPPTVYGRGPASGGYDDDDFEPEGSSRFRTVALVAGAVALSLILVTVGVFVLRPGSKPSQAADSDPLTGSATPGSTATLDPTTTNPPAPTTTAKPPTTTTRKAPAVLPKPTAAIKPPPAEVAPPPPVVSTPPGCQPTHNGADAPKADVKAALVAAGQKEYWQGVQPPIDLKPQSPIPKITVPSSLMMAIAQQESGWQSAIVACDGGIGTMQLMPDTVDFVNKRFGTNYNVNTLSGNTALGAQYLEWLIMYFGIFHFDMNFDLSTKEIGATGETLTLERVVVAAYNVGQTALEQPDGSLKLGPVATQYSNNVLALEAAANWPT